MSKHIWRMREDHVLATAIWEQARTYDCTIVPDRACFPVKEAMRLCKVMSRFDYDPQAWVAMDAALTAYHKAQARMKAKRAKQ